MSAAVLREAAALMRSQHGIEHERHEMWFAMADHLETWATYGYANGTGIFDKAALAVATAYLGASA